MKNLLLPAIFVLTGFCPLAAQPFFLKGLLQDSATGKPVEFATLSLFQAGADQPVRSGFSREDGSFLFSNLDSGVYRLAGSLIGYRPFYRENITVAADTDLGRLSLGPSAGQVLEEVQITAQRPLVEVKADRVVFNAENDPAAAAGTALELLRRVPYLSLDADDNILLKGRTNFKVQLNGRSTGLFARNPTEALRGLPASLIRRIEVITSPGARYDAEGAAGIINIVTTQKVKGVNGNLSLSGNTLGQRNGGGSLNVKMGDVGLSVYGGLSASGNTRESRFERINFYEGADYYREERLGTGRFGHEYRYGYVEFSYDFDSLQSISLYTEMNAGRWESQVHNDERFLDRNSGLLESAVNRFENDGGWPGMSFGADFIKKFKRPDQELTLSVVQNNGRGDNNSASHFGATIWEADRQVKLLNHMPERETTVEAVYSQPLPREQVWTSGVKGIVRRLRSEYSQEVFDPSSGLFERNAGNSGMFAYDQDVYSVFSEFSFNIKKLAVKPGFRLEFARTQGAVAGGRSFENDYPAYIPTLSLSLPVGAANSIRLAYTRRIQRPGLWYLKPQINDADPRNVSTGNPYLEPELTQGVEIGLNFLKNGQSLDLGLEQSVTRGAINSFTRLDPATGITINTYENLGTNHRTALNASLSVSLGKKFTGNLESNIAHEVHEGFAGISFYRNSGWTGHLGGTFQYHLGRGFRLQAGGSGHLGRVQLQGRSGNSFYYQTGVSKSFFENEALRLTVQLDHFLQKNRLWRSEFNDPLFSTLTEVAQPMRALRLGVQYRFGKLSENVSRKRGVSNTDKKAGE